MLNTPPHLEARDPRGFVSIFHGTSSSVARRRLRASDLSFWQSMPSFDIGRPGLHLQSGASVVFGGRARENSFAEAWEFQSARPVWGATRGREFASLYTVDFNPRAPCGARRDERHYHHQGKHFNPRAPCGARLSGLSSATCHQHFNPRAPCGARLPLDMLLSCAALFQSTRPVWGATHKCNLVHPVQVISIHAPRVGRDLADGTVQCHDCISIHAPRVGRDPKPYNLLCCVQISIHAPRVGRDFFASSLSSPSLQFQSTRPVWGATKLNALVLSL